MHKQTQTANIGAFQVEKQVEVGVAGAQALGHMGANGTGNTAIGGSRDGLNLASIMASMAVGGAVGQNIAGAMNNVMGGMNQAAQPGMTPPPVPSVTFHVAVNGQATGPYDLSALTKMAADGKLSANSLVWKAGMEQWAKAETVDELKTLFAAIPPIPQM